MRRDERDHHHRLAGELTRMCPSSHRAMHVQPTQAATGTITTEEIPVADASPGPRRNPRGRWDPGGMGTPTGWGRRAHLIGYSVQFPRSVTPTEPAGICHRVPVRLIGGAAGAGQTCRSGALSCTRLSHSLWGEVTYARLVLMQGGRLFAGSRGGCTVVSHSCGTWGGGCVSGGGFTGCVGAPARGHRARQR
jgi:hypothetical protein